MLLTPWRAMPYVTGGVGTGSAITTCSRLDVKAYKHRLVRRGTIVIPVIFSTENEEGMLMRKLRGLIAKPS